MDDFEKLIMPGVTHWQHPRFHAYFPAGNSFPSILADMISDALGCVGFSWVGFISGSSPCEVLNICVIAGCVSSYDRAGVDHAELVREDDWPAEGVPASHGRRKGWWCYSGAKSVNAGEQRADWSVLGLSFRVQLCVAVSGTVRGYEGAPTTISFR